MTQAERSSLHAVGLITVLALLVSCVGEKAQLVSGPDRGKPLAKLIGESTAMARAVVVVTLMDAGTPVEDATVSFSRSVAGRETDYAWEGITDADGKARIEITVDARPYSRKGASGYYQAKATDGTSGDLIGTWGSIPIGGGREVQIALEVGGSAEVTNRSARVVTLTQLHEEIVSSVNAHDAAALRDLLTPTAVYDYVPYPQVLDPNEVVAFFDDLFVSFPDIEAKPGITLASGNVLVIEHQLVGSHLGEWQGIPATGATIRIPHIDIYEYEGGRFGKVTTYLDVTGMVIQMGAMEPLPTPDLVPSFAVPAPVPQDLGVAAAHSKWFEEHWNGHDLESWAKMVAEDVDAFYGPLLTSLTREQLVAVQELYGVSFPDIHGEVTRLYDMGNGWLVIEAVIAGTNDGPFFGVPATGLTSEARLVWITHWDGGLFDYFHVYWDGMKNLVDLGLAPAP